MSISVDQAPLPPLPPIQSHPPRNNNGGQPISHSASDLEETNIQNRSENTQVDSSNIENSQVNINQNLVGGQFEQEWLMDNFSVTPRHQVSATATTDTRGNAYFTATYTHNFGVPKIAKRVREQRLNELNQRMALRNMQAEIEFQAHCAKLMNAGLTTPQCESTLTRVQKVAKVNVDVKVEKKVVEQKKTVPAYW